VAEFSGLQRGGAESEDDEENSGPASYDEDDYYQRRRRNRANRKKPPPGRWNSTQVWLQKYWPFLVLPAGMLVIGLLIVGLQNLWTSNEALVSQVTNDQPTGSDFRTVTTPVTPPTVVRTGIRAGQVHDGLAAG
jgi:hypothetical protein